MVSKGSLATFEVETNWEEEPIPSSASMQQLKQKLKAGKRPKNAGWNESPTKGEIEIVIPNKKFKGSEKLQPSQAQMTPEVLSRTFKFSNVIFFYLKIISLQNSKTKSAPSSGNRRVNFVLNKNTAQGK